MAETGLKLESATVQRLADGRFLGQGFDLVVPLPPGPYEDSGPGRAVLRGAFETAYREKFALTPPGVPVEFINIRVAVRAPVSGSDVVLEGRGGGGARAALQGHAAGLLPGGGRLGGDGGVRPLPPRCRRRAGRARGGGGGRLHARGRARRDRARGRERQHRDRHPQGGQP